MTRLFCLDRSSYLLTPTLSAESQRPPKQTHTEYNKRIKTSRLKLGYGSWRTQLKDKWKESLRLAVHICLEKTRHSYFFFPVCTKKQGWMNQRMKVTSVMWVHNNKLWNVWGREWLILRTDRQTTASSYGRDWGWFEEDSMAFLHSHRFSSPPAHTASGSGEAITFVKRSPIIPNVMHM